MISTATALIRAWAMRGSGPTAPHTKKVKTDATSKLNEITKREIDVTAKQRASAAAEGKAEAARKTAETSVAELNKQVAANGQAIKPINEQLTAAKAAQNMLLRTLSREWGFSHRNVSVVALHPGTVESPLSAPFISKSYSNRVLTARESAAALIAVIDKLHPGQSGEFFDWQGARIPW